MKTRYSNCKCGETAFDEKLFRVVEESGKIVLRKQYRCRNCQRLLNTRANESFAKMEEER